MTKSPDPRIMVALLLVSLIGGCKKADEAADKPTTAPATTSAAAPSSSPTKSLSTYPAATQPGRILAGDLLSIQVSDLRGAGLAATFAQHVAADGTVLPLSLSNPVPVAGMTNSQVEEALIRAYHAATILEHADVVVRRIQIAGTGGPVPGTIGKQDLLRVTIGDLSGPGTEEILINRIDGEGKFGLAFIGSLKLAGLTEQQAQTAIAKAYDQAKIIEHAPVSVLRLEAAPPDADKLDIPDVAIYPVPDALRWLYETDAKTSFFGPPSK